MIGIIMLLGLLTNNAILLVDHANERRTKGEDKRTALVEAGIVVPGAYSYFDDFGAWVRKLTQRNPTRIVPVVERS